MPGISTGIGLRHLRIGLRDATTGIMAMPDDHVVGTCWPGLHLSGAATLTLTPPEPERVQARGDDRVYHTFHMPPTEGWTAELTVTKQDLPAIALVTGALQWSESGLFEGIAMGTDLEGLEPDIIIWGQRMGADTDPTSQTFGATVWEIFELMCAKATPMPASREQSAVGEHRYAVTMQQVSRRITGEPFTQELHGCTKATYYPFIAEPGKAFFDWDVGDAAEDAFVLTHIPTSATDILIYVDGVNEPAGWSLDVEGKTVTFSSPPADGEALCFLYTTGDTL